MFIQLMVFFRGVGSGGGGGGMKTYPHLERGGGWGDLWQNAFLDKASFNLKPQLYVRGYRVAQKGCRVHCTTSVLRQQ